MLIHSTIKCIFVGHIYAVVAPKDNEWGTNYWLTRCIEGKQTLITSLTDDEGIEFPIGLMVFKGEYLTLDGKSRKPVGTYSWITNQVQWCITLQTLSLVQTSNCKQC